MKKKIKHYLCVLCVLPLFLSSCAIYNYIGDSNGREINKEREKANENYEKGSYKEAEAGFRLIIKQDPNDADSHYKLGVLYGKQGLARKSCHEFLKTISINPDYAKANDNLGVLFFNDDSACSSETAAYFFKKYLTLDPSSEHRETIEGWLANQKKETAHEENLPDEIFIYKDSLNLYKNPSVDSEITARIAQGEKAKIIGYYRDTKSSAYFFKIKLINGQTGWIHEPENR